MEVWNPGSGWKPYAGIDRPRGVEWGYDITEDEAASLMDEWERLR
jgi:hypothetical protein